MGKYRDAIAAIESRGSGDYNAINKTSGAVGRYQVMPQYVPQWTKEALGKSMTPDQFKASPSAQDAVFDKRFGGYLSKSGNPNDAASMWRTGQPLASGGSAGAGYAKRFGENLKQGGMGNISGSMGDIPAAAGADAKSLVQQHGGDINRAVDDAMTKQGENAFVNRQDLADYMRTGGHNLDPQTAAYCAAFTGAALEHAGVPSMHSNVATSYLNWGSPATGSIQKGDVLVMSRGHSAGEAGGHVGIATGKTNGAGQVEMIAGNTGGIRRGRSVSTSFVDPKSVTARRYDQGVGQVAGGASGLDKAIESTKQQIRDLDEKEKNPSLAKRIGKAAKAAGKSLQDGAKGGSKPREPDAPQGGDEALGALGQQVAAGGQAASQGLAQSAAQEQERASHLLDAPQIQSAEQLAGLKPGQVFRDPSGKLRYYTPEAQRPQQGQA